MTAGVTAGGADAAAPMRLLLYGFDGPTVDALRAAGAPPVVWIRHRNHAAADEAGLLTMEPGRLSRLEFEAADPRGADPDLLDRACDLARDMFRRAADRVSRYAVAPAWTAHESRMRLIAHHLEQALRAQGVTHAAMSNIPHDPGGIVLEALCRAMGVDIVYCHQSAFPDRYYIFRSMAELGTLDARSPLAAAPPPPPDAPEAPFYMRGVRRASRWRLLWKRARVAASLVGAVARMPVERDRRKVHKALRNVHRAADAQRLHAAVYVDAPDPGRDFVYVPLHIQPELTVDVMGWRFGDQALMVETLARAVPEGWLVYVKDHPRQLANPRDDGFLRRLRALPNVRLIAPGVDTYALLRSCRCVASCVGTAGWEALLMGKPAIAFGAAWWRRLPGAFVWDEGVDFAAVAAFRGDRARLAQSLEALGGGMRAGLVDRDYVVATPGFDPVANGGRVAAALLAELRPGA